MSMPLTFNVQAMEYEDLDREIKRTMRRSAKDVVQLGFLLRQMAEKKIWEAAYDCFDEYLDKELHMDYSLATRFMNINRKYSVSGASMEIAAEYEGYSQGLLIEMLNMAPELEAKVTPDMTVKQVRGIKKQAKAERETPMQLPTEEKETVIDGEYREIRAPEEENVATSQQDVGQQEEKLSPYGLPKTVYPEGSLLTTVGCGHKHDCFSCAQDCEIRQKDRYCNGAPMGNPFPCTTMHTLESIRSELGEQCQFINLDMAEHTSGSGEPAPCCKDCDNELCGYRCQRSRQPQNLDIEDPDEKNEEEYVPEGRLQVLKYLLEQKKSSLDFYLKTGCLSEAAVRRDKSIVEALSDMVCDLETAESTLEPGETMQPELPVLKNNDQRKEWLAGYKAWGLWYRDVNIDVSYYKYDFSDGSRLIVAEYPQRQCYWKKNKIEDEHFYHLLQIGKEGYRFEYNEKYRNSTDSETYLVEFLKKTQKKV